MGSGWVIDSVMCACLGRWGTLHGVSTVARVTHKRMGLYLYM